MDVNRENILSRWEPVIGLEVHIQLNTKTKMFCGCRNLYGAEPNTQTCQVCLGLPGALPVANEEAVNYGLRMGLAVDGVIRKRFRFARKNYFYPDLTKGYQISQYDEPLIDGGVVRIWWQGKLQSIELTRIHLEEDAAKSVHGDGEDTLVDFNRCGVPLIEIVSEPVIKSPDQAHAFLQRLKQIALYLDISDANMEMGQLRCDANISLRPIGNNQFGTKTEMKNMNSFRAVEKALWYEIQRQAEILDQGKSIRQCTLLWNEAENKATVMRTKEDAHDYRYFPDPDLVPLEIKDGQINAAKDSLPELPHEKEQRWVADHDLRMTDAQTLADDPRLAHYFDSCIESGIEGKVLAKWILGEVLRLVREKNVHIVDFPVKPDRLTELISKVQTGVINQNTGKIVLAKMMTDDRRVVQIVEAEGLGQVSDLDELEMITEEVLTAYPSEVERYQDGKTSLFGFFMGAVMKSSGGTSNPGIVKKILEQKLSISNDK